MTQIMLVNGPNLNLLGSREKDKYGSHSFEHLITGLKKHAKDKKIKLVDFQSNSEGAIIDFIHAHGRSSKAMILNPGAYTHTSVAIRDAILSVEIPFIEIHITNVYQRESFRHHSYFKDIAIGQIVGLGIQGYFLALDYLAKKLEKGE